MSAKVAEILMYLLGPLGILIVFLANKELFQEEGFKQHLNQVIIITIGYVLSCLVVTAIAAFVFQIWGLIKAIKEDDSPLPLIGNWRIVK